ncbi:MAG TPA: ATP-binding protein [Streptosporangiaceae bacterium]|nr:ATP-binding protein [Streptosporangiaceae bacterium]
MNTGMTAHPPRLRVAEPVVGREFSRSFPGRPDQAGAARAFVRGALPPSAVTDDLVLAASELVANAISHTRSGVPGGVFTVRVVARPGTDLRVEVDDAGGRWEVQPCDHEHGRGLAVVAGLAGEANWGVAGGDAGRTVWVRFGWPGAAVQETMLCQETAWPQEAGSPADAMNTQGGTCRG